MNKNSVLPLVAIVGPTASGKSSLAVWLAQRLGGEVVACDSTQLYRGFDIGTAKPSGSERQGIPHHLIDVLEPTEEATAGGYRERAEVVLAELRSRKRLPIFTVGTGLYLRALLLGLADVPQRSEALRERLRARGAGRIGVRGPGEKKLETDRRRIRDRIARIKESIEEVRQQRALRREARNAVPLGTVTLVGYTNAGKSTLFNALSRAEVLVSSRMFATLDPTVRAVRLPSNRRILVSDTVGFIRELPKGLITAFRATLEEVQEAALLLQVSDISNVHHDELDCEVDKILAELGVLDRPRLHVFNKVDRLTAEQRAEFAAAWTRRGGGEELPVFVSAITGEGLDELLRRIDVSLPTDPLVKLFLHMPLKEGRSLALIHSLGRVLRSEVCDSHMDLEAEIPAAVVRRLKLEKYTVKEHPAVALRT
jgi:50S ribosomal subunit-associated GTPase HflX